MLLIFIRSGISLPVLSFDMLLIQQKNSIPAVIQMIIIFLITALSKIFIIHSTLYLDASPKPSFFSQVYIQKKIKTNFARFEQTNFLIQPNASKYKK